MTPQPINPAPVMDQVELLEMHKEMFWHYHLMEAKTLTHQHVIDSQVEHHLSQVSELTRQLKSINHLLTELNHGAAIAIYRS